MPLPRGARLGLIPVVLLALPSAAHALCSSPGDPDCVAVRENLRGTIDFFATGAAFTINNDADDRPDALLEIAQVDVPQARIPNRATLRKAFLYFGGSLYQDGDGNDEPDDTVELQVPGTDTFQSVTADQIYESGSIPGFPGVSLYNARADITQLMLDAGGEMAGRYRVQGFAADIFDETREHTAANASFSIILIFEEERLPPRNIVLFDGMQEVLGSTVTLDLAGFIVSPVPSGSLTVFALEGDCNPGPDRCADGNNLAGTERIQVIGSDGSRNLVLQDALNPPNDVFNRTINTVTPPLMNVTGTDIDTFDVTDVLTPGDESMTVEVTSPLPSNGENGELIGLAYVIVGIDVFAPELRIDSRIEIRTERGQALDAYFPGDPLRVLYGLSNTGNLPGTEVRLEAELPENATAFLVLEEPEGASVTVEETGGAAGRGRVVVENWAIRHGEVNDLVLLVETECPLPDGGVFAVSADVGSPLEGGSPFTMTSTASLLARNICGPRFFLFGGGGCSDVGRDVSGAGHTARWLWLGLLFAALIRRRRRLVAIVVSALALGCSGDVILPDQPPPFEIGFECPDEPTMVALPSIAGLRPFCIDRYEASVREGELGNPIQPIDGDGSTTALPISERLTLPVRGVTWFQARAACANVGKRLCASEEWITACRGPDDLLFPYGNAYDPDTCNGFDSTRGNVVETGGMIVGERAEDGFYYAQGCVSTNGVYDLSGNLWEWNETSFLDDKQRGLAGGSFRSNRTGLRCVIEDSHTDPGEINDGFGFRCCKNFPGF